MKVQAGHRWPPPPDRAWPRDVVRVVQCYADAVMRTGRVWVSPTEVAHGSGLLVRRVWSVLAHGVRIGWYTRRRYGRSLRYRLVIR